MHGLYCTSNLRTHGLFTKVWQMFICQLNFRNFINLFRRYWAILHALFDEPWCWRCLSNKVECSIPVCCQNDRNGHFFKFLCFSIELLEGNGVSKALLKLLLTLQNSIMLTPRGPSAWPIAGVGAALPAITRSRAIPLIARDMLGGALLVVSHNYLIIIKKITSQQKPSIER